VPQWASAQCPQQEDPAAKAEIDRLYEAHAWADVVARAQSMASRSADVDFEYGMALAHLQRWAEARAALAQGRRACPGDKRFPIELAGVAFQQKDYATTATWLRRGLKLDPRDPYALDFAGTDEYLLGNLPAALKYWNRVRKPEIANLRVDPQLHVNRLLVERAIAFAPTQVMKESELETTEARIAGLGIFPAYSVRLNADKNGKFDAEFNAVERDGFGAGRLQALVAVFSGLPYETIYPSYYDIGRGAVNVESLLRWDAQKRRAWAALSAPMRELPQWRWQIATDERAENWDIRQSFAGPAPVLGSLHLTRELIAGTVTGFASGRTTWQIGAEGSHRDFTRVSYGSALNASLVTPGYEGKVLAAVNQKILDVPERRFSVTAGAASELARLWSAQPSLFDKLQGSLRMQWLPEAKGDTWQWTEWLRAGDTFGRAPFDELYMLGVERDNDLWLRGEIGTRDGRKGSSPLGTKYLLANNDLTRRVYSNGLIGFAAGPLFDVGRMGAPTSGLAPAEWLFSAGAEVRLNVLGTGVVLTYGRDLRLGTNAFYGTAAQPTGAGLSLVP
jgi:tetratricopeptide (TPR) repeat protein